EAHLASPNAIVVPRFVLRRSYGRSLLCKWLLPFVCADVPMKPVWAHDGSRSTENRATGPRRTPEPG
ncbi:MAG: hypothetical protein RI908_690, partial [Actinomycetota bacterium]